MPLLTFVGDAVHRPLIRGVKGGEGATGGPGWGRLLHHRGRLDETAVQGVLQVVVGHYEGKELLSVPILLDPPSPHASQEGGMLRSSPLPNFPVGVGDRDSIPDMGTALAAHPHQVPQPSIHRSHQPAVVVTSITHAWGRVAVDRAAQAALHLPPIPTLHGRSPAAQIKDVRGRRMSHPKLWVPRGPSECPGSHPRAAATRHSHFAKKVLAL